MTELREAVWERKANEGFSVFCLPALRSACICFNVLVCYCVVCCLFDYSIVVCLGLCIYSSRKSHLFVRIICSSHFNRVR